jgi:tRNA(Ile)-lysidine synthase
MTTEDTGDSPESLIAGLQASFTTLKRIHPARTGLLIALSGGLDSMSLLHACHQFCQHYPQVFPDGLRVIHVNHGLSPKAGSWQQHCVDTCASLGTALVIETLELQAETGQSLEEKARDARYAAFARHILTHETLLLAHHQDDFAETVLLRLMRGAGPRGLSAIPISRSVADGILWRPLLGFSRAALEKYAKQNGLHWVDDESNSDVRFSRNFLRQQIGPYLSQHWPSWQKSVMRSAVLCAEAEQLLQEMALEQLQTLTEGQNDRLTWVTLPDMSRARQRLLIRHWLLRATALTPPWQLVQRIMDEMLDAGADAQPEISWRQWLIRRHRDALYLLQAHETKQWKVTGSEQLPPMPPKGLIWSRQADGGMDALVLPGNGVLRLHPVSEGGMRWPDGECRVLYRQGGERCALAGRPRRALKKIMQEADIPPWIRTRTPLLYVDGELAWIPGAGVCEGFAGNGVGWAVVWQMP